MLLIILVFPLELFPQLHQLLKQPNPFLFQFTCIMHLPVMLNPIAIQTTLNRVIPRRIPLIRLDELHHHLILPHPSLVLRHNQKLHLLVQILPLLLVLKVRDKLLDGFHHLGFGEIILCKKSFQFLKEGIHFGHGSAGGFFHHA